MFAIYTVASKGSNPKFIGLSPTHLTVNLTKIQKKYDLRTISQFNLDRKKKLIPLISGGIIASLSLLAMVLHLVSFNLIAVLCLGLLLFYYGFTEYVVITVVTDNAQDSFWLSPKQQITDIRPLSGFLEYFVKFKRFPALYVPVIAHSVPGFIHSESHPQKSTSALYFQFFEAPDQSLSNIKVDPTLLDSPIHIKSSESQIGFSEYKINYAAVIAVSQAEIS